MKNMLKLLTALTLIAGFTAIAENASFDSLDADKDGYISQSEAAKDKGLNDQFINLDADEDGKLSRDEFAKYEPSK